MATFETLIQINKTEDSSKPKTGKKSTSNVSRKSKKQIERGCKFCPQNETKGITKIFGKVRGKRIMFWAQSPGSKENKKGKELIGPAGKFLWAHAAEVGIKRKDVDVQNVVRCFPADWVAEDYLKQRDPKKEEIHCCSIYNEKALKKSNAKVHVIFGKIAADILLGKELHKDRPVYYSDRMNAHVVVLDHPSYFLHGAPKERLEKFRDGLQTAAKLAKGSGERFGYLKKQNYIGIVTQAQARKAFKILRKAGRRGECLIADVEVGLLDKYGRPTRVKDEGKPHILVCGFSVKMGTTYVFCLDHPDHPQRTKRSRRYCFKAVRELLEDAELAKGFHHGCSDIEELETLLGWKVRNFSYDTEFGEYFRDPDAHSYGLTNIVGRRFPNFIGYKEITIPETLRDDWLEYAAKIKKSDTGEQKRERINHYLEKTSVSAIYERVRRENGANYALMPWWKIVLYNGADCDIQKRIEKSTREYVNPPLMKVYIDASFILAKMETPEYAPVFDYKHYKELGKWVPAMEKYHLKEVRKIARKIYRKGKFNKTPWALKIYKNGKGKNFNPGSWQQIYDLLYDQLELVPPGMFRKHGVYYSEDRKDRNTGEPLRAKPDTGKDTLELLSSMHPAPGHIKQYRYFSKMKGTYLEGFRISADRHQGTLRTRWWLTGTGTGRLSSGGGKNKKEEDSTGIVNLQNIHGDAQIQCLVISDKRWRKIYRYWKKHGDFKADKDIPKWIWRIPIMLGFDHSQMELRVLCQRSGDKALIIIFSRKKKIVNGKCVRCKQVEKECGCGDPHSKVGHELTGWKVSRIKENERTRRIVKAMQFGIVFGLTGASLFNFLVVQGVYKLGRTPKEKREELKNRKKVDKYLKRYFRKFHGVKEMINRDHEFVEKNGYAETLFGMKRPIRVGTSDRGAWWENQAVNTGIQGTAHQLMLMGYVPLRRKPIRYKRLQRPTMEIHDAVYFYSELRKMWKAAKDGQTMLEKESLNIVKKDFGIKWKVRLAAEAKAGYRFGVMTKLDKVPEGPNRTARFLSAWCNQNDLLIKQLKDRIKHVSVSK